MKWADVLKPLVEHGLAGLMAVLGLFASGEHDPKVLVTAFLVGAGLSAKPNNLLK